MEYSAPVAHIYEFYVKLCEVLTRQKRRGSLVRVSDYRAIILSSNLPATMPLRRGCELLC